MKLLLTGGGTGGHIYPALAIAAALEARGGELEKLFVGSADRLEATLVPAAGIPVAFIASAPLVRGSPFGFARTLAFNALGIVQSLGILHRYRPDAVVATGGYVSFPVVVAARIVRWLRLSDVAIGLLEPNARSGLTNRVLAPLADERWLAYGAGHNHGTRTHVTGAPVRPSFSRPMSKQAGRRALGLDPDKTTVVAFGGSQGARSINEALAALAARSDWPSHWQLFLVRGGGEDPGVPGLRSVAYIEDPRPAYAAADVIVARAGASTLAELSASGVPAILIPYPFATDDHQSLNAAQALQRGVARVIPDRELDGARLLAELNAVLEPDTLQRMREAMPAGPASDAAGTIAARIEALCAPRIRGAVAKRAAR